MTYRNKLLIKRLLIFIGILILLIVVVAAAAVLYLGKYVVYTEDGAYFSFLHQDAPAETSAAPVTVGSEYELIMGDPVSVTEILGRDDLYIADSEIQGLYLDYDTLKDGSTLASIDLSSGEINTLMLEMRRAGDPIIDSLLVQQFIHRAQEQNIRLIALFNALTDDTYAETHQNLGLQLYDGLGLWAGYNSGYFLDLRQDGVITYLTDQIRSLNEMGFHEVVLDEFFLPESGYVDYGNDERTLEESTIDAYNALLEATVGICDIGLLIRDADTGHQALDAADHLFVCFHSGSEVQEYLEDHPEHYVVFITDSHDTRFDAHGKLFSETNISGVEETEDEASDDGEE